MGGEDSSVYTHELQFQFYRLKLHQIFLLKGRKGQYKERILLAKGNIFTVRLMRCHLWKCKTLHSQQDISFLVTHPFAGRGRREDLGKKPHSSVPNPPPHLWNPCVSKLAVVVQMRSAVSAASRGSGGLSAAGKPLLPAWSSQALAITGICHSLFPLHVIPTEQGPAAAGGAAAILYGVNNTAVAWPTETRKQHQ